MQFITTLDIVNACLKTMGETRLNTLEEDHSHKDDALEIIDRVQGDVLAGSLWFNTEWLKLSPQADTKNILIPNDALKVEAETTRACQGRIVQRGSRLYDVFDNTYEFTAPVTVKIARHLNFENLPYEAQAFIRDDSVLRFQNDFDGDNTKYAKIKQQRDDSLVALNSEHIRQIKANPLYARVSVRVMSSRYGNYGAAHPYHWHTTFPG